MANPPPYSANWTAGDGAWTTAANWTETDPAPGHAVPGVNNSVSISTGSPVTITYNTNDEIWSLGGGNATLSMTGGTLTVDHNSEFDGITNVGANATLSIASGASITLINGAIDGTLAGAGNISLVAGTFSFSSTTTLSVASLLLGVATNGTTSTTTLGTDKSYAGHFTIADVSGNDAVFNLNGHTMTLTGQTTLGGTIKGPGTLVVNTSNAANSILGNVTNGAAVEIKSQISQTGGINLNGLIQVDSGATYTIKSAANISDNGATDGTSTAAQYLNNGSFVDDSGGGSSTIFGFFTNNGTLTVNGADTLTVVGTNTLGGVINGAGTLGIASGATTISTTNVTVASIFMSGGNGGGSTILGVDLSYGGIFNFNNEFGALALNGHTLTLSGGSNTLTGGGITGPGKLKVTGASNIGAISVGSGATKATIEDAGSMTQTGFVNLDGALLIDAAATYTMTAFSITDNGATTTNNGSLVVDTMGGQAQIGGVFNNNGTLTINATDSLLIGGGVETLGGAIGGAGALDIGFAAQATITTTNLTVGSININGGNGGGTTTLGVDLSYGGVFNFSNQFGTLALNGHTLTLSGASDSVTGGTLTGAGTLKVTGTSNIGFIGVGSGATTATIEDAGSMTQIGGISLDGALIIDASKTYTITSGTISDSGATTTNNGSLIVDTAGGQAAIGGIFINNGALSINVTDSLLISGTETLGGVISGAGTLDIGFAAQATITTTNLTVGGIFINGGNGGGTTTLGVDLSYGGVFNLSSQFGTLALNGHTLTLSGASDALGGGTITGAGTLKVTGTTSVGFVSVGSGATKATLEDAGTMNQTGNLSLDGTLQIDAAATYTLAAGTNISDNGATIINNGTFNELSGGGANVSGAFVNNGMITVANGASLTMFSSSITGAGSVLIESGATFYARNASFQQNAAFSGAGVLAVSQTYGGLITGFKTGDEIVDTFLSYTAGDHVVLQSTSGGVETFAIDNSSNQVLTTLNLVGSYQASSFDLRTDSFGELVFGYGHGVDRTDFNLDGFSDITFQNTDGAVAVWEMDGASIISKGAAVLANPGTSWKPVGSGDFFGSGQADILLEDTSGDLAYWAVNQSSNGPTLDLSHTLQLGLDPGATWKAIATGDFNGDGMSDIVLQNVDGSVAVWEMNGASLVTNGASVLANPGTGWQVRGTGDFYDNGLSDILLQRDDGSLAIWGVNQSSGGPTLNLADTVALPPSLDPGAAWVVKGIGDFNGDGLADIVFQNSTTGDVAIWEMNGANLLTPTSATVISPGSNWHLTSVGDYNGDGKSDLLLQNSNDGSVAMWFMNGLSLLPSTTQLSANPGLTWTAAA